MLGGTTPAGMRIAIDGRLLHHPRTGMRVYLENVLGAMARRFPQHTFGVFLEQGRDLRLPHDMPNVRCLPHVSQAGSGISRLPRQYAIDHWRLVEVVHAWQPDVFFGPAYLLPCGTSLPFPSVITIHDASLFSVPFAYQRKVRLIRRPLIRLAAARADAVIFPSNHVRHEVAQYIGHHVAAKGHVINHALPSEVSAQCIPSPAERAVIRQRRTLTRPYVIAIGTVQPRKNYARLVRAMADERLRDLDLVICGGRGWHETSLHETILAYGMHERVHFVEGPSTSEMLALLAEARVFVFPSIHEGFGIPPLEAFKAEVPVCASNVSSIPEVTGDAALLFDPLSIEGIATAILRLHHDDQLRARLIAQGTRQLSRFSWERAADEHLVTFAMAYERFHARRS